MCDSGVCWRVCYIVIKLTADCMLLEKNIGALFVFANTALLRQLYICILVL